MSDKTGIEWADATWNCLRGCSRVSAGCQHCYAERVATRFGGPGMPYEGLVNRHGAWNGEIRLVQEKLIEPLRWRRPRRVFVNSMSDLFHENVPESFIHKVFDVMARATQHTFQVLTKRPMRMRDFVKHSNRPLVGAWGFGGPFPLPNVWLGVSCEDQATADERIPILLETPTAVRWISAEPLLGPIDLGCIPWPESRNVVDDITDGFDALRYASGPRLDWVVAGGESGPGARPAHPDWFRSLKEQCQAAGVAFFMKQLSQADTRDFKDFDRFPPELKIREMPDAT